MCNYNDGDFTCITYKDGPDVPTLNIPGVYYLASQYTVDYPESYLLLSLSERFVRPITTPPSTMRLLDLASQVFVWFILIQTSGM
jgi:hypothetical protein